jgi:hypothetical protein
MAATLAWLLNLLFFKIQNGTCFCFLGLSKDLFKSSRVAFHLSYNSKAVIKLFSGMYYLSRRKAAAKSLLQVCSGNYHLFVTKVH